MVNFDTIWPGALASVFDAHGVAASYTPYGGAAVACTVILHKATAPQPQGYEAQAWGPGTTIESRLSETTSEPNRNDTFLIGSTTYTVQEVLENDDYVVKTAVT